MKQGCETDFTVLSQSHKTPFILLLGLDSPWASGCRLLPAKFLLYVRAGGTIVMDRHRDLNWNSHRSHREFEPLLRHATSALGCIISYIFRRRQLKLPDDVIIEGTWTEGEHSDITFPVLLNRDTSCHLQHISSTACLYIPALSVQV